MTNEREDQYDETADTEIEIETVAEDDSSDDDQFQKAEDATQKRINRLTKKCARPSASATSQYGTLSRCKPRRKRSRAA
jgi:hypothetical protein